MSLVCNVETASGKGLPSETEDAILGIYQELRVPLQLDKAQFVRSLHDRNTILITLKIMEGSSFITSNTSSSSSGGYYTKISAKNEDIPVSNKIVGYVKGGPLENYTLRRGTNDENL